MVTVHCHLRVVALLETFRAGLHDGTVRVREVALRLLLGFPVCPLVPPPALRVPLPLRRRPLASSAWRCAASKRSFAARIALKRSFRRRNSSGNSSPRMDSPKRPSSSASASHALPARPPSRSRDAPSALPATIPAGPVTAAASAPAHRDEMSSASPSTSSLPIPLSYPLFPAAQTPGRMSLENTGAGADDNALHVVGAFAATLDTDWLTFLLLNRLREKEARRRGQPASPVVLSLCEVPSIPSPSPNLAVWKFPHMKILASVCRALAFALVLLSTAAPASADSPTGAQPRPPTVEEAIERARALMVAGEPGKALDLLRSCREKRLAASRCCSRPAWPRCWRPGRRTFRKTSGTRCSTRPSRPCMPSWWSVRTWCGCAWSWPGRSS